jgi:formiminotetrahydrofolate cyclodeaminase
MSTRPTAACIVGAWAETLAAKSSTPGGGAAAAVVGAVGAALGAMSARYTTGERHPARHEAAALADALDDARARLLALADADADAFNALKAARNDPVALAAATEEAVAVPERMLDLLLLCGRDLAAFAPCCNAHLVSDLRAACHLLTGAAAAAAEMILANQPDDGRIAAARAVVDELRALTAPWPPSAS